MCIAVLPLTGSFSMHMAFKSMPPADSSISGHGFAHRTAERNFCRTSGLTSADTSEALDDDSSALPDGVGDVGDTGDNGSLPGAPGATAREPALPRLDGTVADDGD